MIDFAPDDALAQAQTPDETNAVLRAADAWEVEGFGVWDTLKIQIAAEMPEPTQFRADALSRTIYEVHADDAPIPSPALARLIALWEETQPDAVQQARAQANRVPVIDLTRHTAQPDALATLPAKTARETGALPIRKTGSKLWVAFAAMPPIEAIDAVRMASRHQVIPMIATPPGAWEAAFSAAYPVPAAALETSSDATTAAELLNLVRGLQNEISLLRQEVETLKQQAEAASDASRRRALHKPTRTVPRRISVTPLFPLATPADLPPFGVH